MELVVVTGGSQGIGRALVLSFLTAGYAVVTCARNPADLVALAAEQPGAALHTLPADLSQPADCQRFASFVLGLGLPLAALLNKSGQHHALPQWRLLRRGQVCPAG
ncbi:MAG: SDR family NAD(P)-dependent oxidoreductase, partial [Hymenobacter sp.]